jgi:hypothetical protein
MTLMIYVLPRRWLRFGLRTMLLTVTMCCLVLGWCAEKRRRLVNAIESIISGGDLVALQNSRGTPDDLTRLRLRFWDNSDLPRAVFMLGMESEDEVVTISEIESLQHLILFTDAPCDAWIRHLRNLKHLSYLRLRCPHLSDRAIDDLAALRSLTTLCLDSSAMTAEGLEKLRRALPTCRIYPLARSADPYGFQIPSAGYYYFPEELFDDILLEAQQRRSLHARRKPAPSHGG